MVQDKSGERPLARVHTLALVGAGRMGAAMLQGWFARGLDPKAVSVFEPQPSAEISALAARGTKINPASAKQERFDALVIAVKPQTAPEALAQIWGFVSARTVAVSIMAGRTIAFLEKYLPDRAIVRAMPNTPAAIGRGITVAVPNKKVDAEQRALANDLLAATGEVAWVDDERLMDAVTAVSGSGPAYVFLLAEALARAGVAAGLPEALAARLARATVAGSGELLHRSADDAATLRKNVTSPGGTTAAALEVLMGAEGLDPLLRKAVEAAAKRSRDLAN